ncbi:E3 ubiquitin-protein ligase TRIM32-like [Branchiostoma floridae x Branchiostoma belcheri]
MLQVWTFNRSIRDDESTSISNILQHTTLSSNITSSDLTPTPSTASTSMPTTPSKMSSSLASTPSMMSSNLPTTPSTMSSKLITTPSMMSSKLITTPSMMSSNLITTPSMMSSIQLTSTMSFDTTRPESEVRTTKHNVLVPTTSFYKERHTEILKSEKIILGGKGSSPGRFRQPNGVAVSSDNEIYVADRSNKRVQVFSVNGVFLRLFKTVVPGTNGQSMFPEDVAIDRKGHLLVVGSSKFSTVHIVKYSREGLPKTTFDLPQSYNPHEHNNLGIAVDVPNDRIVVISHFKHLNAFSSNGSLILRLKSTELLGRYITSDNDGNIIVPENNIVPKNWVQVYHRDGYLLFRFSIGNRYIEGICTDTLGNIVVATGNKVKMFTSRGEFVRTVARIRRPDGIALGPDGRLVVSSIIKHLVTIFPRRTV